MPEYRTRTGIEIARAGNYDLSTGPFTFTREQFASAVANATTYTPRIKLGHVDPRFDGEPSLGFVRDMRLAEDGDALVADLVDIPAWLDDALGNAYPGRSIEASTNAEGTDMRVTALSLLGVTRPGIDTMADLEVALAAAAAERPSDPDVVQVAVSITQLRASAPDPQDPPAAASADEPHNEETPMDETVRTFLVAQGLDPEQATEDQINAASVFTAAGLLPTATPVAPTVVAEPEPVGVLAPEPTTAPSTVAVPVAAAAPAPGTVVVDEQRLAALEAAEAARREEDRNRVLASAMTEGRFAPSRHQHYLTAWEADPAGTRVLLTASATDGGLAPNTVPVIESGANPAAASSPLSLNRALAASGLPTTPKGA